MSNASQTCRKRAALSDPSRIDGAAQNFRVVGDESHGPAFDANQRGNHGRAEFWPKFEHRTGIRQCLDELPNVVNPHAIFGNRLSQQPLIGAGPLSHCPLKIAQILLGDPNRIAFILGEDIDDAVGFLHLDRTDFLGFEYPKTAAFDHRRTTHADVRSACCNDHIAAAKYRRVARETAPRSNANQGRHRRHARPQLEAAHVPAAFRVSGTSAAAFAEEYRRQSPALRGLDQSIHFAVVVRALSAGKHRIVICHHRTSGGIIAEAPAINPSQAHDHAVSRSLLDQLLQGMSLAACCHHQAAVLDEGSRIEEIVDILARGALPGFAAPLHGGRALFVQCAAMPFDHGGKIRPDKIEINVFFGG